VEERAAVVALGGVLDELDGIGGGNGQSGGEVLKGLFTGAAGTGFGLHRRFRERRKVKTQVLEQTGTALRAVLKVAIDFCVAERSGYIAGCAGGLA
jgi:hypothetical protein